VMVLHAESSGVLGLEEQPLSSPFLQQ